MTDSPQTVTGAYDRIEGHEKLCAERYRNIQEKMNWIIGGLGVLVFSLVAWMAMQLYTLEPLRVAAYSQTQTVVTHTVGQK